MATIDHVAELRAFNRFYTRIIGLLDAGISKTTFSLAEARVLYEIAKGDNITSAQLARELGVDPAYLSRIRLKLVDQGLIAHTNHARDRRKSNLSLTAAGEQAFTRLSGAADAAAEGLLEAIAPAGRDALIAAMRRIRAILDAEHPEAVLVLRRHRPGDIGHIVSRQGVLYAAEYGWDESYEGLAAEIAGKFLQQHDPAREACVVAERAGDILGSVFLVDGGDGLARLRLLYVEPDTRGLGLGTALVADCVARARAARYRRMTLWTQSNLDAARRIYAAAGFQLIDSSPHRSFGKDLVGETWELALQ